MYVQSIKTGGLLLSFMLIILTSVNAQSNVLISRNVLLLDISDDAQHLFNAQVDTFSRMYYYSETDSNFNFQEFYAKASVFYFKNGYNYGFRYTFNTIGGIGCGYHESDQPYKIHSKFDSKAPGANTIYDFKNNTVWYSSENWEKDKIVFYFKKGFPALTKFIFFNGDQSSEENWKKFARPKKIKVLVNNKFWGILEFEDVISKHEFTFPKISTNHKNTTITLVFEEVYEGSEQKKIAISDINFDGLIH